MSSLVYSVPLALMAMGVAFFLLFDALAEDDSLIPGVASELICTSTQNMANMTLDHDDSP